MLWIIILVWAKANTRYLWQLKSQSLKPHPSWRMLWPKYELKPKGIVAQTEDRERKKRCFSRLHHVHLEEWNFSYFSCILMQSQNVTSSKIAIVELFLRVHYISFDVGCYQQVIIQKYQSVALNLVILIIKVVTTEDKANEMIDSTTTQLFLNSLSIN